MLVGVRDLGVQVENRDRLGLLLHLVQLRDGLGMFLGRSHWTGRQEIGSLRQILWSHMRPEGRVAHPALGAVIPHLELDHPQVSRMAAIKPPTSPWMIVTLFQNLGER